MIILVSVKRKIEKKMSSGYVEMYLLYYYEINTGR